MSLSKVFKDLSVQSTPFIMEDLGSPVIPAEAFEAPSVENVGGGIEELERQAYEQGFAAGERAGFEFGRQKAEVLFNSIGKLLDELANFKESLYKPCEKEMTELSLAIAKKVVQREIEGKSEVVLDCVRASLKSVVSGGEITIRVNPKDLEIMLQYKNELARFGDGVKGVCVEGDESVGKGGCVIYTNFGEIDSNLDSVMAEIEEKLRDAYSGGVRP